MVKKKKKLEKSKVTEYFEIEKKGKGEIVKAEGKIATEKSTKKEIKGYNKVLWWFLGIVGILIIFWLVYWAYSYSQTNFEYKGIEFKYIREKELYFYQSQIPLQVTPGKIRIYNIYTRKDPREIEKDVPFIGNIELKQILILNSTKDFACDGDGTIGVANIVNLYSIIGIKVGKDLNASCDGEGRYMYLLLDEGEENKIEQIGESCYKASIANCDILKVTERFLYESLFEIKKKTG